MIPNSSESNELDLSEFLEGTFSWINRIYIVMDLFKIVQLAWDTKWIIQDDDASNKDILQMKMFYWHLNESLLTSL